MTQSPACIPESEALDINEQRLLTAKAKRTGARNYPSSPSSVQLHYLCSSEEFLTTGGVFLWFMRQIKEGCVRVHCTPWLLTQARCTAVAPASPGSSSSHQGEKTTWFSAGCWMCLHTRRTLMTSSAQQQRGGADVVTVTEVMMKWSAGPHTPALLWLYARWC